MRPLVLSFVVCIAACSTEPTKDDTCVDGYPSLVPQNLATAWLNGAAVPRTYVFDATGHFTVRDAVAPCPEGAACVWSGIVENQGTYTIASATESVTLAYTTTASAPDGSTLSFPTRLDWVGHCGTVSLVERPGDRGFTQGTR